MNFFANSRQSFLSTFKAFWADTLRSSSKQFILDPSNISLGPGTGYAATGVPQFKASVTTIPNVSVLLGNTKTSEDAKYDASAPFVFSPKKISLGNSSFNFFKSGPFPIIIFVPSKSHSKKALMFFSTATLPT